MYSIKNSESKSYHLCYFLQLFLEAPEFKDGQKGEFLAEYNKLLQPLMLVQTELCKSI